MQMVQFFGVIAATPRVCFNWCRAEDRRAQAEMISDSIGDCIARLHLMQPYAYIHMHAPLRSYTHSQPTDRLTSRYSCSDEAFA